MRLNYVFFLLATFALVRPGSGKECGHLVKTIPSGVDPSTIPVDVCEADQSSFFSFVSKPILAIIDKFLGRKHLSTKDYDEVLRKRDWSVINIPSYANHTSHDVDGQDAGGWQVRVHGTLYKLRDMKQKQIDKLVDRILLRASIRKGKYYTAGYKAWFDQLSPTEADQARRQVRELATVSIQNGAIEARTPQLCNETSILNTLTNSEGAFEQWITLPESCDASANRLRDTPSVIPSTGISLLPLNVLGARNNDSRETQRTFFVPPRGISIVSDVDDVLRVAEVWNWKQAILDLFARPYQPWLGMADVYHNWSQTIPIGGGGYWKDHKWIPRVEGTDAVTNVHFHYISDTPDVNAAFYMNGTQK